MLDAPTIEQCLFHRCEAHAGVPMLNADEEGGAECGACIAAVMLTVKAQLLLALDGYAERLAYSHRLRVKLEIARNKLNLLADGAGDFLDDEDERTEAV